MKNELDVLTDLYKELTNRKKISYCYDYESRTIRTKLNDEENNMNTLSEALWRHRCRRAVKRRWRSIYRSYSLSFR